MRRLLAVSVVTLAGLVGCGEAAKPPVLASTSTAYPPCESLYGRPFTVEHVGDPCLANGVVGVYGVATMDCPDGRILVWNDIGYGIDGRAAGAPAYSDELFVPHHRADGQRVPPDDVMERCRAAKD